MDIISFLTKPPLYLALAIVSAGLAPILPGFWGEFFKQWAIIFTGLAALFHQNPPTSPV
jgi:hypothetical protein